MKKVNIFSLDFISSANFDEIVHDIINGQKDHLLPLVITPNVDQIVKLNRTENRSLFEQLKNARYILPDGQPLVTLSKLKLGKNGLTRRLTGADLFVEFWSGIKASEHRVLLITPSEEVGRKLSEEYSNSKYYTPPMYSIDDLTTQEKIISDLRSLINTFNPRYLIIGLGFPKQENLFFNLIEGEDPQKFPLTMLLGASFEFYLGVKKRAPKFMQKLGLEFLHRFLSEPRRMFKRYFIDDVKFIPLAIKELKRK